MTNYTYPVNVTGYKFFSELDALQAVQHCATYYDNPKWTQYWTANYDNPVFWFILSDDSLVPVLGQPINFEYLQMGPSSETNEFII